MAYDINGNYYVDPLENENWLSSGIFNTPTGAVAAGPAVQQIEQEAQKDAMNPAWRYDTPGFTAFGIPNANSGQDNKYEYIQNLVNQGAVKLDGTPLTMDNYSWSEIVRVPEANAQKIYGTAIDYNPSVDPDYGPLLGSLFLGGVGLASGGFGLGDLFSGASGTSGAGTAATGAFDAAAGLGGATSAGAGSIGGATSFGGLGAGAAATTGGAIGDLTDWFSNLVSDPFSYNYTPEALYGPTASGVPLDAAAGMFGPTQSGWDLATALGSESTAGALSGASGASAFDLIKQYGTDAAKALNMTKADGSIDWAKVAAGGMSSVGGLLSGNAATDAARITADAQLKAAQIAADAAKFKPVGVASRFGTSQFGYDDKGNLTSAGYNLAPDVRAQQDTLMGMTPGLLAQYQGAQAATAPMGQAASTMMNLGNQYLATTPEQQAQKYMAEQQALLATGRERDLSTLQNKLLQQGRMGLATGGTSTGMMAANPEMEAFYNAQRQQDLGLAAQATQGGMDYAKFGSGMVGSGGDMLRGMYSTQSAARSPWDTAMGGATYLEGLGQQTMDAGINIGAKGTAANAQSGALLQQGMLGAAQTMQPANAYSPWGSMLSGAGNAVSQYTNPQQQYQYDPYTGRPIQWGS